MNKFKQRVVGVIQARMGSSRFPEKMSADLGGLPLIDWVIIRSKKSKLLNKLLLATSTLKENEYLIEKANNHSIEYYHLQLRLLY